MLVLAQDYMREERGEIKQAQADPASPVVDLVSPFERLERNVALTKGFKKRVTIASILMVSACTPIDTPQPRPIEETPTPKVEPTSTPTPEIIIPTPTPEAFAIDLIEAGFGGSEVIAGATQTLVEWEKEAFETINPGFRLLIDKDALREGQTHTQFTKKEEIVAFYLGIAPVEAEIDGEEVEVEFGRAENPLFFAGVDGQRFFANPWSNFSDELYPATVALENEDGGFEFAWARVDGNGVIRETLPFWEEVPEDFDVRMNTQNGWLEFVNQKTGEVDKELSRQIWEVEVSVPQVEGLRIEDGKYYAEVGNPYGLEVGEYAGERIVYNDGQETGIVLVPDVVRVLMEQVNTPEAIARGEWKIPFPLDPRGESNLVTEEWFTEWYGYRWGFFNINGLSPNAVFVCPFIQERVVNLVFTPGFGSTAIQLQIPDTWSVYTRNFYLDFPGGSDAVREGNVVRFGERLLWGVSGGLTGPDAPPRAQVILSVSPGLEGADKPNADFNLTDNILKIEGEIVFVAYSR